MPTTLPTQVGTFHREADPKSGATHTTAELAPAAVDSIITRLVDDPAANAAKWKQLPALFRVVAAANVGDRLTKLRGGRN